MIITLKIVTPHVSTDLMILPHSGIEPENLGSMIQDTPADWKIFFLRFTWCRRRLRRYSILVVEKF